MSTDLADAAIRWYDVAARDLPWRTAGTPAWGVLVSEIMLQQTPVARVLPVYGAWMLRWPAAVDLASDSPGEAVRMWGKLGYPRRALRLHECAVAITERHAGDVPADVEALEALPGIGSYTARAVAAFAFEQRHPVVDTNVRRFAVRAVRGEGDAPPGSARRDHALVEPLLPADATRAARASVAFMELGALVCTAKAPRCSACPVTELCAWHAAGRPAYAGTTAKPQRFAGTDRQVRGLLMDVLRAAVEPVPRARLDEVWSDAEQRDRALDSLLADGLVMQHPDGRYTLPA